MKVVCEVSGGPWEGTQEGDSESNQLIRDWAYLTDTFVVGKGIRGMGPDDIAAAREGKKFEPGTFAIHKYEVVSREENEGELHVRVEYRGTQID